MSLSKVADPEKEQFEESFGELSKEFRDILNDPQKQLPKIKPVVIGSDFQDLNRWNSLYPKECVLCGKKDEVQSCSACRSVFYCSAAHQKQNWKIHKQYCGILKHAYEDNQFLGKVTNTLVLPSSPLKKFTRLKTWDEWFEIRKTKISEDVQSRLRCLTDKLTFSLTVFSGLLNFEDITDSCLRERDNLTIFVLGPREFPELANPFIPFRELTLLLPQCDVIKLVFIGPDVPEKLHGVATDVQKKLKFEYFRGDFHTYEFIATQHGTWKVPQLVVAFHSGIHDSQYYVKWRPTVKLLMKLELPTVFTSFTEQEHVWTEKLLREEFGTNIIFASENPFRSLRVQQESTLKHLLFCFNSHVIGFMGVNPKKPLWQLEGIQTSEGYNQRKETLASMLDLDD